MYLIPLVAIILLGLIAVAWSPIFALVFAVIGFLVFLAIVSLRPRADEVRRPPARGAARGVNEPSDAPLEDRP
ncbi:MAG TPA: hypothetical protein VHI77_00240 [Solirubrobacterales bacterium]|jgi:hypothetical protein|nr:hypothetical protein [Solirubrobacterales bacterium]